MSVTTVMVTMRDGVRLATDVHLPAGDGPFPVLMERTPYGRAEASRSEITAANRTPAARAEIARGFTVLNKMARASARSPHIRQILVAGPLEYIVDAPKARELARKRLSPVAQGYMASLCE